ncbi:hypothetical protein [Streptococcus phocae]|uniref:Uncharacterized protein n=1 Tax=Streptococcus phocae TaxID=119224 RepID=A0A0P6SQ01_9STRE|nr:hypothetical protein [Streptococcus phocae]KPJ21730.1 hypothetical protein AKK44_08340 [Streptococcus phocae]
MWDRYGAQSREYPTNYLRKSEEEREKALLSAGSRKKEQLFKVNKRSLPLHINRNEYVQQRLIERQQYWEQKKGTLTVDYIQKHSIGYSRIGFTHHAQRNWTNLYRTSYKNGQKVVEKVNPFAVVKVGTWQGYAIAATDVMRDVGHNRLDVLRRYL